MTKKGTGIFAGLGCLLIGGGIFLAFAYPSYLLAGYNIEYIAAQVTKCPVRVGAVPKLIGTTINVGNLPVAGVVKIIDIVAGENDISPYTRAKRNGISTCGDK